MDIYVIEASNGHVKIGISQNAARRLAQLQAATTLKLSLAHSEHTEHAVAIERNTHATFAAKRLTGEWFEVSATDAVAAVNDAVAEHRGRATMKTEHPPMTPAQYRTALERLGLTQKQAAQLLGVSIRTAHGYAHGWEIPIGYARLLRLVVRLDISPEDVK